MTEENSTPEAEQPKPRRGRPPKQKVEPEAPAPAPAAEEETTTLDIASLEIDGIMPADLAKRVPEPKASIGRIVRYVTGQGTIRPAIISALVEEDEVQLTVFNSQGAVFADNVPFAPEDAAVPGTYHWPTFD